MGAWLKGSDSSYTPEEVMQGAGVQVFGDSGKVMASGRQSSALGRSWPVQVFGDSEKVMASERPCSALGSHETGKFHEPAVS